MPASAIASLPFMPILKLIVLTVVVVVVVVLVTCGCGSEQPKSVRVRSASVAFRRSVLIVDLRSGSLTVWCRRALSSVSSVPASFK